MRTDWAWAGPTGKGSQVRGKMKERGRGWVGRGAVQAGQRSSVGGK